MIGQVLKDSSPALAAVVLAAGASTRMGRPKALLVWRGRSFLRHAVALAEAAGAAPIVVVEGAIPLPAAELGPAFKVTNPTWPNGQTDSLRRGLRALLVTARTIDTTGESADCDVVTHSTDESASPRAGSRDVVTQFIGESDSHHVSVPPAGVLVLTVDRPHVRPATVAALAAAFRAAPGQIWQPVHAGRRGHPILYPACVIPDLLALEPGETPRDWLARPAVAALRRGLEVDDPAVLDNLDRGEDLTRLP